MGFEDDYLNRYGKTPSQKAATQVKTSGGLEDYYSGLDEEKKKKARIKTVTTKPVVEVKKPSLISRFGGAISALAKKAAPIIEPIKKELGKVRQGLTEGFERMDIYSVLPLPKPVYAPESEEDLTKLQKEYQNTLIGKFDDKYQTAQNRFIKGLTGGIIKPEEKLSPSLVDKIVGGVAEVSGTALSISTIGNVFGMIAKGSVGVTTLIDKFPKVARYVYPLVKNIVAFDIYGQLDPDLTDRFKTLGMDTLVSVPFTGLGFVKKAVYSIPASFGLGFGLAKLDGASNEDAFISGSILGVLDGWGRMKGKTKEFVTGRETDRILRVEAVDVINRYSDIKIKPNSSLEEITRAYRSASTKTHPDIGGTVFEQRSVNAAYEYLSKKSATLNLEKKVSEEPVGKEKTKLPSVITEELKTKENLKIPASDLIETSVVQTKDIKTNKVEFKVIPKGQLEEFKLKIDDTQKGIAGVPVDGKVWHITAKTPDQMLSAGAVYTGEAKIEEVPTKQVEKGKIEEKVLYRGVPKGNTGLEISQDTAASYGKAIYLTDNPKIAQDYNKNVVQLKPTKPLSLYTPTESERLNIVGLYGKEQQDYINKLLGNKYNGLKIPEKAGDGNQIIIYNKDLLIPIAQKPPVIEAKPTEPIEKKVVEKGKPIGKISVASILSRHPQEKIPNDKTPEEYAKENIITLKEALKTNIAESKKTEIQNKINELQGYIKGLKEEPTPEEKQGKNLMEFENADLTLPELKKKLEIAIEGKEDPDLIKTIREDIVNREKPTKPTKAEVVAKITPKRVIKPSKVKPDRIFSLINKKNKTLGILDAVKVKDGNFIFTDLDTFVIVPTELEDGMYQVVGKDFIKSNYDPKDYPEVIEKPEKEVASIKPVDFIPILKKATVSISDDETRPVLNAASVEIKGGKMTMVTTDGFRLFFDNTNIKGIKDSNFLLPVKNLNSLIGLLGEDNISIREGKEAISFSNSNGEILVKKIIGDYPSYKQVFPAYNRRLKVNRKQWQEAMKTLQPYVKDMSNIIDVFIKDNEIVLRGIKSKTPLVQKEITIKTSSKIIQTDKGAVMKGSLVMPVMVEGGEANLTRMNVRFGIDVANQFEGNDLYIDLAKELNASPIHFSDKPESVIETVKPPKPIKLTKKEEEIKKWIKSGSAPSGASASIDRFADIQNVTNSLSKLNVVEFPELLRITKELIGGVPAVKKPRFRSSLGGRPLGLFVPSGKGSIVLNPAIFKDPSQAAKTFAHEIGHLTDYLPDQLKNIARGNLLGRIATLSHNMKGIYGDLKNKEVKEELKALTQLWKPFNEEEVPKSFVKYRYSPRELYADAISVLLNDPDLLKETAPTFWKGFFEYIDRKPEVKENFFAIWDLLNQGEEAVLNEREKDIRDMFKKGEDLYKAKLLERQAKHSSYVFRLKYELIDRNQAVIDLIDKARKAGKYIPDDKNPIYWLEGNNYVGGKVKAYVEKNFEPIYKDISKNDTTWEDFGEVLFLERVINERGKLANPLGYDPKTAQKQLNHLKNQLGPKWSVIERNLPKFREAVKGILDDALESGLYKPELVAEMKANPAYATYQVLDYLDVYIPASIKHQVGTLKEISNPASSTVTKTISIVRAIERNRAKRSVIDFMKKNFPDEIKDAKTMWTGKTKIPIDSRESDEKLFTVMEDGKYIGYYVDPYISDTMEYMGTGHINAAIETFRFFNSKAFRPLFITYNLGFQSFNLMRDFQRSVKSYPDWSVLRSMFYTLEGYKKALKPAFRRAFDLPDKTIQEMENAKILSVTYNDVVAGMTENDKQIDLILNRIGLSSLKGPKKNIFYRIPMGILDTISRVGNLIETLPKVAGYERLKGKIPSQELASFIRTSVGSPDFLRRGAGYSWYNEVFLFSNAIKEGIRADYNIAFKNPRTRSGYWWKTAVMNFLPKLLMFAALSGIFGKALKKMMEDASEYDKTNYTIVPMGRDQNGQTIYLRVPQDESGRLLGGILWKTLRIANNNKPILQDISDILSFTGGQVPGLTPTLQSVTAIAQYLGGQNPYDWFRGRYVIPDQEFKAGPKYSLKPFLTWQFNQMGGGIFQRFYTTQQAPTNKTWLQKVIEAPVVSNILGRWIKVSDYGQSEKNWAIIDKTGQQEAAVRIENKQKINDAIKKYKEGSQNLTRRLAIERQLVKDIVGKAPYTKERKTAQTNTIKKFRIALIKGESDEDVNALISATSNEQKVQLLKQIKLTKDPGEYDKMVKLLLKEKIISKNVIKELKK